MHKMRKKSGARLLRTGSNITQSPKRIPGFNLRKRKYMLAFHQLPDKTTDAHITNAKQTGQLLELLVPYLPFDGLFQSPALKEPKLEYNYIQKALLVSVILD